MSERNLESTVEMLFPTIELKETLDLKIASLQMMGTKKTQEDRNIIFYDEIKKETVIIMLDAHGEKGVEIADQSVGSLEEKLKMQTQERMQVLGDVFSEVHQELQVANVSDFGGAVVTVCCIHDGKISFGYVGDCELRMVGESGEILPSLTEPHDRTNIGELERIYRMNIQCGYGGVLSSKNKGKRLSVYRALGDSNFPGVTCLPDFGSAIFLDKFAIVASDGFWKIIKKSFPSGKENRDFFEEILQRETEPEIILQKFREYFLQLDLPDNLTISIIKHK